MNPRNIVRILIVAVMTATSILLAFPSLAQLIDKTKAPNNANEGINKSLTQQIGAGRGDLSTVDSSAFIIARDPFRSIRRGRQLFQRKFTRTEGQGPVMNDGVGDINTTLAIGAGLSDSCASCHGRPRGSAGFGGDVATRPDSRDAPHLFGLGLKEMLADEITADLRLIKAQAISDAAAQHRPITRKLSSKGIKYGTIVANPDGAVDTTGVEGVDNDLRVRPFFHHGGTISIREFVVGALNAEMGLQAFDPDLIVASEGARITTPAGMVLDGSLDSVEAPRARNESDDPDNDGKVNEVPASLVDHLEFYLLNYFKPATYEQTATTRHGRSVFEQIGCNECHIPDLQINRDRRVADVETVYDPVNGIFNNLFATASPLFNTRDDGSGFPALKTPLFEPFLVRNIFTDFKRHDVGPNFFERNYDGTIRTQFLTTPLWGIGSTSPYGHDGRSINLLEVILRHGGEAQAARDAFNRLSVSNRSDVLDFLNSLVLFPPDDTASTLNPGNRNAAGFPQFGHGSIRITNLFNNPADVE
ncbi:MAG TPA: di-heme oxidoredictase family protein [Pyrinomonadaceae bacterium]|nr:di-heme oxidoredictase family protein [Pyrinomonadaceae bacterium]